MISVLLFIAFLIAVYFCRLLYLEVLSLQEENKLLQKKVSKWMNDYGSLALEKQKSEEDLRHLQELRDLEASRR